MHVIGHHHEFIQQDMGKMFGDRQPTFPNDVPDLIEAHHTFRQVAEQTRPVLAAVGDEIRAGLGVVVPLEANATSAEFFWTVRHNLSFLKRPGALLPSPKGEGCCVASGRPSWRAPA
jgi:hypothetical protein